MIREALRMIVDFVALAMFGIGVPLGILALVGG